uniref:Uncharacterized protein n=1 Tax=Timema poppense TaxID=170557 RepID=A0A7R9DHE2_TIMPO|nr:unnamed protein product [Timema poppensis]
MKILSLPAVTSQLVLAINASLLHYFQSPFFAELRYSAHTTSLVLTDSSQLISDSSEKSPDQIMWDLGGGGSSNCQYQTARGLGGGGVAWCVRSRPDGPACLARGCNRSRNGHQIPYPYGRHTTTYNRLDGVVWGVEDHMEGGGGPGRSMSNREMQMLLRREGGEEGRGVDCCPSVLEMVEPEGGKNADDMYVELFRDGDKRQRFYELSCRQDVEGDYTTSPVVFKSIHIHTPSFETLCQPPTLQTNKGIITTTTIITNTCRKVSLPFHPQAVEVIGCWTTLKLEVGVVAK